MLEEDEFVGKVFFVKTGLVDEDWEVVGGCRVIVAAADGFVREFFIPNAVVALTEGILLLSTFAFPGFRLILLPLLSGINGLFGFLSIVTLSFPLSFPPPINFAGTGGAADEMEIPFDIVSVRSLLCSFVWLFGASFASSFDDDTVEDDLLFF